MNHYFKEYLKNTAAGAVSGATLGMACGSGAGISGLMQSDLYQEQPEAIRSALLFSAASAGANVGFFTGATIGAVFYPAYKLFVECGLPKVDEILDAIIDGANDIPNRGLERLSAFNRIF